MNMRDERLRDCLIDRLDLSDLTKEQIAPLEALMDREWSQVWRDLALSHYITLTSTREEPQTLEECAQMAVTLALGVAQDLGGKQHYIQAGTHLLQNRRAQRVMELLRQGVGYHGAASATGLSEPRVRRIERNWRAAQKAAAAQRYASAQGRLQLD
jgi:Mor family transcriptional regulator